MISDPQFEEYRFCGYDNKGDLYVGGVTSSSEFVFAELPHGKNVFLTIKLERID